MKHDALKKIGTARSRVIKKVTKSKKGKEKTKGERLSNDDWSVQIEVLWKYFLSRERGEGFFP